MKSFRLSRLALGLALVLFAGSQAFAGGLLKPTSKNPEAQKLIDQAWTLNKTDSTAKTYKDCLGLVQQADKLDPNNPAILTEISRYYWNWGDNLPKETKEQKKFLVDLYIKAMDAAQKSIALKETVDGHYWLAVNKAASLEFESIISQAGGFPMIKKHADYVTKHDPKYYYYATGRLWSEIIVRIPKVVVTMVHWNVEEAVSPIDAGIKNNPGYLENFVYKARFLYKYYGKNEEALKLIDHALKQDANTVLPDEVCSNKTAQKDARILWKQITGKDYPNK
jgi:tetratricopeptide (TPR) repeat protein